MIKYEKQIEIEIPIEEVFELIDTMPNKFPVYRVLESKPFFFVRALMVNGFRGAIESIKIKKADDVLLLKVGDSMGPFTLTEYNKPQKYWFTLESLFFNCRTGYTLDANGSNTTLHFDLISEYPKILEKMYWFLIRPIHGLLAEKVLNVIKIEAEKIIKR